MPAGTHCQLCPRAATTWDHHPLTRARLIAKGIRNPDHPRWLRPLCGPCHSRETVAHDGGFGRAKAEHDPPSPSHP